MYTKGQRVVIRESGSDKETQALVEDIIVEDDGQRVKVKMVDGSSKTVASDLVVEQLED